MKKLICISTVVLATLSSLVYAGPNTEPSQRIYIENSATGGSGTLTLTKFYNLYGRPAFVKSIVKEGATVGQGALIQDALVYSGSATAGMKLEQFDIKLNGGTAADECTVVMTAGDPSTHVAGTPNISCKTGSVIKITDTTPGDTLALDVEDNTP